MDKSECIEQTLLIIFHFTQPQIQRPNDRDDKQHNYRQIILAKKLMEVSSNKNIRRSDC